MGAFREFKAIWDPDNKLNPHKVVDAYLPTENLRLGADYAPLQPRTYFSFPDDGGSLARATLRCIGLGECRKHETGSMCPSYMVTLEEEHSTRGRAHLLFELLQGEVVRDGPAHEGMSFYHRLMGTAEADPVLAASPVEYAEGKLIVRAARTSCTWLRGLAGDPLGQAGWVLAGSGRMSWAAPLEVVES